MMSLGGLAAIVLDCRHAAPLARFWAEALGWAIRPYDEAEIARLAALGHTPDNDPTVAVDAPDGALTLFCVEVPEPKSVKNRLHLDVRLTDAGHLDRLLARGATVLDRQPGWTVLADPEDNEFCALQPDQPAA